MRDELSGYIILSTQDNLPIVLNFFLAVKGLDRSSAVAGRQASYNSALGARGIYSLELDRQEGSFFTNTASIISLIYYSG